MSRMFLAVLTVSLVLVCAVNAPAQTAAQNSLPIKRVVLYKHGVGYFERLGQVDGAADVALRFKTGQMNDLLKSLTVLDLGGGTIQSIGYDSTKTVAQQLGEYTFDLQNAAGLPAILQQMKGAEVALQVPAGPVTGRVLAVEKHNVRKNDVVTEENRLSVLLADGSVKSYELSEIAQVQFTDPRLQAEMQKYLATLFSRHRRDEKQVVIRAAGKGKRDLFASYIQEQPVWKVSYRIVLSDKKNEQPLLQGWAIVDNVSGEEWKDVDLALVSGLPVSFVQNLYDPWYVKRPMIALLGAAAVGPVTYAAGEELMDMAMEAKAEGAAGMVRDEKPKADFARKSLRAGGMAAPSVAAAPMPNMAQAMEQQTSAAAAQTMGALFRYDIKEPVSIATDRSAMLPIVNSRIDARRVSIYDQSVRADNPMDGLILRNTTGLTLEGGPITVYEQETYSGEALIETFPPLAAAPKDDKEKKDQRLISFAVDLGTRVNPVAGGYKQDFWQLRVINGVMYADYRQQQTTVYNLNNVEARDKTVVIQHPYRADWKLVDTAKPMEQTPQLYRFDVPLAANKQAEFKVTEENPGSTTVAISNANPDIILFYARQRYVTAETKAFLEKVAKLQGDIAELNRQSQEFERQKNDIAQSQNRVRQNMQALGGTEQERTLRARYVKDFEDQENKFRDASTKQDAIKTQIESRTKELKDLIAGYTFAGK